MQSVGGVLRSSLSQYVEINRVVGLTGDRQHSAADDPASIRVRADRPKQWISAQIRPGGMRGAIQYGAPPAGADVLGLGYCSISLTRSKHSARAFRRAWPVPGPCLAWNEPNNPKPDSRQVF